MPLLACLFTTATLLHHFALSCTVCLHPMVCEYLLSLCCVCSSGIYRKVIAESLHTLLEVVLWQCYAMLCCLCRSPVSMGVCISWPGIVNSMPVCLFSHMPCTELQLEGAKQHPKVLAIPCASPRLFKGLALLVGTSWFVFSS